ncbi:hypothetical protein [Pseudomonas frederiksbergensis]|uniref:hypothetical protein n=1 Tax=Pseudomonas frederiksbergensis TaxID=104087 RepID=UPI00161C0D41|nr:hypothetical protein [Pseudomonas frederiksbergensis]
MFHEDLAVGKRMGLAQDVALDELVVTILIVLCDVLSVNTLLWSSARLIRRKKGGCVRFLSGPWAVRYSSRIWECVKKNNFLKQLVETP